jgi:nucleoid-associated protein YgaU|tara:strand:+ start:1394 stop:1741 length:348 start_codon:yes stop_codon:yes gene_type:complete
MVSRYDNRNLVINSTEEYRTIMEKRGVKAIKQFTTGKMKLPTPEQIRTLQVANHIWKTGDHFYKLAHQYYGDSTYWWVIAIYNLKPTEASVQFGDTIFIPMPLQRILKYLDVSSY